MELFSLSISLCNVSQKGHTYIEKAFTKDSIMEFFLDIERKKAKRKRLASPHVIAKKDTSQP